MTDTEILQVASNLFPMWREDIQPQFVLRVSRAVLEAADLTSGAKQQATPDATIPDCPVCGDNGRVFRTLKGGLVCTNCYKDKAAPVEMRSDFTDTSRAALMWVLWHHQGGSSPVGQPIRFVLGMGQHERLADWQIAEARRWAALPAPERPHGGARWGVEQDTRHGMGWNRHIVDNHGRTVCFMAHSDGKDSAGDAQRAYLVAAAPALLDALRELVRICENCDAEQSTANAPSEDEYQATMNAAEEAIAWAGGEYGY